jgi:hypothetical protein
MRGEHELALGWLKKDEAVAAVEVEEDLLKTIRELIPA